MNNEKNEHLQLLSEWRKLKYREPELRSLFLEVTSQCNEACLHCGSNCDAEKAPFVPTEKLIEILADVKRRMGTDNMMLCITGGEPLLRSDFFELMTQAHELGFPWGMTTNGTLITPACARRLAGAGMSTVSVSVDGLPATHDRFRGREGSYDEALRGVHNLIDAHAFSHVQVTTVVTKWSIGELEPLFEELANIDIDSWRIASIEPMGRALDHPELLLDGDDMRKLLEFIRTKRSQGWPVSYGCCHYLGTEFEREVRDTYFICNAGIYVASIMANGDIGSCLDIERCPETIMGNVYTDDFVDVWQNGFGPLRRELAELDSHCTSCEDRAFCAGGSWHSFDFNANHQRVCLKGALW